MVRFRGRRSLGTSDELDAVAAKSATGLAGRSPQLLDPGAAVTYVEVHDTVRRTSGYSTQVSGCGYHGQEG